MAKLRRGASESEAEAYLAEVQRESRERLAQSAPAPAPNGARPRAEQADEPRYVAIRMSDVQRKPIRWLWPDKLAYGKLSLLVGDGDLGKSWAMLDLAARLSTGTPLPGQTERTEPSHSVLLMGEDDPADTIGPRLDAQGADSRRVTLFQGVKRGNSTAIVRLHRDLAVVERLLRDTRAVLLVIDGLPSYMGGTDGINEIEVRQVLLPLADVAQRTEAAIVAIMHRNKGEHRNPVNAIGGSVAFGNVARCVLGVAADRDSKGRRCLVPIKGNILKNEEGIGYRITEGVLYWDNEPVSLTRETIFATSNGLAPTAPEPESQEGEAQQFLLQVLTERGGRVATRELKEIARDADVAWRTLERVKPKVGVRAIYGSENGRSKAYWGLPDRRETGE